MFDERLRVLAPALTLCLLATACKSKPKSDNPSPPDEASAGNSETPVTATGGDAGMLFSAAGTGGAIGIAVWPNEWSKLSAAFDAVAAAAPGPIRSELEEVKTEVLQRFPTAWSVIRAMAARADQAARKLPEKLDGLDESRPIVVSLFAPLSSFDELGLAVIQRIGGGGQPAPHAIVHRFAIPADDSHSVRDALVAGFEAGGLKKSGEDGARVTLGHDQLVVSIGAAKLWVEVVVLSGDQLSKLSADEIANAGTSGASTDADKLFASTAPSLVRLQVRAHRIAEATALGGMRNVDRAIASVSDDDKPRLFIAGLSEILSIFAATDPAGAAHTDVIAELPASDPGAVHAAIVLTAGGVKAFKADPELAKGASVALADVNRDAVIAAAPLPPAFQGAKPTDVLELFHECGWGCMAYSLGANGLSVLKPAMAADKRTKKELDQVFGEMGSAASGRVTLHGSLLVFEGVGASKSRFRKANLAATEIAQSDSDKCYHSALLGLRTGLRAVIAVAPKQLPALLGALESETRADLDCAAKDAGHAKRVDTIRKILVSLSKAAGGK